MPLTLTTTANNYHVYKIQIAAKLAGVDLKVDEVKTVHTKLPLQQSPVLETEGGLVFQSNAIMRYLARTAPTALAYGQSILDSAQVDQWIDWSLNNFEPARGVWLFPVLKMMNLNMKSYNAAKKDVSRALKTMNNHLQNNTFFVGHQPTIADAAIFSALLDMYTTVFSPNYIKGFTNVTRWFNTVAHHPAFAGVVGEVVFATEEKKAEMPKKKQQQPKKKKQQQQQKKKPKKEKPKHWSALLPPSSMNMDATKKLFFNKQPFNETFFDTFWDNYYDAKGHSFYTMKYQYNDENVEFWKTQNQVGMYIQKLVHARKHAFGVMAILGEEEEKGPWSVEGAFLFKGDVPTPELKDCPGTEYYTFTKVDTSTEEGRALIKAWYQEDVVNGSKVLDKRYFK